MSKLRQQAANKIKETQGYIGVLAGSLTDLGGLDFSPWGFQCFHIKSEELKEWVKHNSGEHFDANWDKIYNESRADRNNDKADFWDADNLNVLVPISLKNLPS